MKKLAEIVNGKMTTLTVRGTSDDLTVFRSTVNLFKGKNCLESNMISCNSQMEREGNGEVLEMCVYTRLPAQHRKPLARIIWSHHRPSKGLPMIEIDGYAKPAGPTKPA
jgi:hypothetical protein